MLNAPDDTTYRVKISPDTGYVEIQCFGMNSIDTEAEGTYMSVEDIPQWVKERLAVLRVLPLPPPPQIVEDLGARINEYVFWIVRS